MSVNGSNIRGMDERVKTAADKFVRAVNPNWFGKRNLRIARVPFCRENGDDFPGGVQQVRSCAVPRAIPGSRQFSGHVIVASIGRGTHNYGETFGSLKDRPRTRKCQLKIKCLLLTLTKRRFRIPH